MFLRYIFVYKRLCERLLLELFILRYFPAGCKEFYLIYQHFVGADACIRPRVDASIDPYRMADVSNLRLEDRHNGTVVGVVDEVLDGVAGQGSVQGLDGGVVLVAFLHDQNVGVGLGSLRRSILDGQGVGADGEAGLHCVVAVDDGEVNVLHGAGQLSSLDLLDLDVVGVLLDVVDGSGQAGAVTDGDDALGGQQLQSAGLVGGIVGHGDGSAVSDVLQVVALARIDAERLVVDGADADQMGAVLLVEALEVGAMLEVVGVNLALLGGGVGQDVVGELGDGELVALLLENLLDRAVQNLSVGRGGSADIDLLVVGDGDLVGVVELIGGIGRVIGGGEGDVCAGGGQGGQGGGGSDEVAAGKLLAHDACPFKILVRHRGGCHAPRFNWF